MERTRKNLGNYKNRGGFRYARPHRHQFKWRLIFEESGDSLQNRELFDETQFMEGSFPCDDSQGG